MRHPLAPRRPCTFAPGWAGVLVVLAGLLGAMAMGWAAGTAAGDGRLQIMADDCGHGDGPGNDGSATADPADCLVHCSLAAAPPPAAAPLPAPPKPRTARATVAPLAPRTVPPEPRPPRLSVA